MKKMKEIRKDLTKKRIEAQRIVSGPGSSSRVHVDAHVDSTDHGSGSSSGNAGNHGNAVGGENAVDGANRVSKIEVDCGDVDVKGHRHGSGSGFSIYSRKIDDDSGNAVFKSGDSKSYSGGDIVGSKVSDSDNDGDDAYFGSGYVGSGHVGSGYVGGGNVSSHSIGSSNVGDGVSVQIGGSHVDVNSDIDDDNGNLSEDDGLKMEEGEDVIYESGCPDTDENMESDENWDVDGDESSEDCSQEEDSSDEEDLVGDMQGASGSRETNLLDGFRDWFLSPDGGSKGKKQTQQHVRQVQKLIHSVGSVENLFNKKTVWNSWLQPFDKVRKPGTIKSYLVSLGHLYGYLLNEQVDLGFTSSSPDSLHRLKASMLQWLKVYQKKCDNRRWEKKLEDLPKLLTPDDYRKFDTSYIVRKAVKLFNNLAVRSKKLKAREVTLMRDYLISYLCMDNGSRTGAIASMRLEDVDRAEERNGSMNIAVIDHKTLHGSGPVFLGMSKTNYRYLALFTEKVRPRLYSQPKAEEYLFISIEGKHQGAQMTSSNCTEQFHLMWKKSGGLNDIRRRMNAGLVRKSFSTTVRKRDLSMKGSLAVFLCHSEKTQEGSYFIPDKIEICSKTATRMRAMMRASNNDNNIQETEKETPKVPESTVLGYFEDNQKITLELVKKKLTDEDLLGSYSHKVIFDKLHYQRKKTNATSAVSENTLPTEEETTMDKMERIGIPVDTQPESGTEEPFSTAGSSVTRTRYNYTEEELDTINREFEDLITGTMTIHELDVKERFQNRPALQYLELMSKLGTRKLADKVRTERKAYKAKRKRKR